MPFIVQVASVRGATQTVPFIVQGVHIRDAQTVPLPSHPGVLAQDLPRRVSVLPSICPALVFIFGQPGVPCPGCILDAYLPLAPVTH